MKHYHQNIVGKFDQEKIYDYVINNTPGPSIFIEVGSWLGKSTSYLGVEIINSNKSIKLFTSENFEEDTKNDSKIFSKNKKIQRTFERRNNDVLIGSVCTTVIDDHVELCKPFHFEEIDFCFISSEYNSKEIENNIKLWWPKIKTGGIIAGDCYDKSEVSNNVSTYIGDHRLHTHNESIHWICRKGGPQTFDGLIGVSSP